MEQHEIELLEWFWQCSLSWLHNIALCSTQANTIWALTESLTEMLKDEDKKVRGMTLSVLSEMFLNRKEPIASSLALQLVEALRPLFYKVKLCAPCHRYWVLPGNCSLVDFQFRAQVGLEQSVLRFLLSSFSLGY